MSTEREEAEVALIKARTGLARSCDYAVVALYLFCCAFGGFTFFGLLGERQTACAYWKSLEAKCHDRVTHVTKADQQVKLLAPNIHMTLVASWAEAYSGGILQVPTPWGPTPFRVNPSDPEHNLYDGLEIRIPGYGQRCNCRSPCRCPRGDLIVTWKLLPPEPGDAELRRVLASLQPQDPRAELAQQMMETT